MVKTINFIPCNKERFSFEAENLKKLKKNVEILEEMSKYKKNWNNNNAEPFKKDFLIYIKDIIDIVFVQPLVFPTARNSIQFSYYIIREENKKGKTLPREFESYLEVELFENKTIGFMYVHDIKSVDDNGKLGVRETYRGNVDCKNNINDFIGFTNSLLFRFKVVEDISFYLKRCPFCGGKANGILREMAPFEKTNIPINCGAFFSIECSSCDSETREFENIVNAISLWNSRIRIEND